MSEVKLGPYLFVEIEDRAVSQKYGVKIREGFFKDRLQMTLKALEGMSDGTLNRRDPIKRAMAEQIVEEFLGSVLARGLGEKKKYW